MTDSLQHKNPFDTIRQVQADGTETWSARQLMGLLGYSNWQNMREVIERAQAACKNSSHETADHFTDASKMIETGKGASREVSDFRLSRYACYLTAMNGDPRKVEIAQAQTYFAIKTREAELGSQKATPTTTPLLISARLIAASTGQTPKAVGRALKRYGIAPTHHFLEPLCRAPAYLWPLEQIKALYDAWELPHDFVPFSGEARPGVAPVVRMFAAANQAKRLPKAKVAPQLQQPLFFSEVERIGAQMGAAIAKRLTEEFIRDELPDRIRAEMTRRVSA